MIIKPPRLSRGDKVAIVAPASAPPRPEAIDECVQAVRDLGFNPMLATKARRRLGFLAGTDAERASDIMRSFADTEVRGIFCVRGGYGTARFLADLDYGMIRRNAKPFVGYSDITSLHVALVEKARIVSFHGPMLNSEFVHKDLPQFTRDSFLSVVCQPEPYGSIRKGYSGNVLSICPGKATGVLAGGNLTLLCASLATPYQPSFQDKILLLEDLDEAPYRLDRMLTQLLAAGLLQQVSGVAVGINKNCSDPKAAASEEYRQSLEDVFRERLSPLQVPVVLNLPFGHIPYNATLPLGTLAELDADKADLTLLEPAVS